MKKIMAMKCNKKNSTKAIKIIIQNMRVVKANSKIMNKTTKSIRDMIKNTLLEMINNLKLIRNTPFQIKAKTIAMNKI